MAGWADLKTLVSQEVKQRKEEGCKFDVVEVSKRIEKCGDDRNELMKIYDELMTLEIDGEFPYSEPSGLEEIREQSPSGPEIRFAPTEEGLYDKFYGAWLGRCIGCSLGKPLECSEFMFGPNQRESIKRYLEGAGAYPLDFYVPANSNAPGLKVGYLPSTREHIRRMEFDDDIQYTLVGLKVVEDNGIGFSTADVGRVWLSTLPYNNVCTAETQVYLNLANTDGTRYGNYEKVDWKKNATYLNPYREWIGAQIRCDFYGYVAAGDPKLAAELAWRDARLSHVKNGIYGEMFVAAVIAGAFVENDPEKLLDIGLSQIPAKSRLAEAVKDIAGRSKECESWTGCCDVMMEKYGHYHPVHTINNALVLTIAMLYSRGDFEKAVTTAVMQGLDTDCNGATMGSIFGIIYGAHRIPRKWIKPLNDTIDSRMVGFGEVRISEMAERTLDIYKSNRK